MLSTDIVLKVGFAVTVVLTILPYYAMSRLLHAEVSVLLGTRNIRTPVLTLMFYAVVQSLRQGQSKAYVKTIQKTASSLVEQRCVRGSTLPS